MPPIGDVAILFRTHGATELTQKTELIYMEDFNAHEQAQTAVFAYMEVFYNRQRCHAAHGYLAPRLYEQTLKTDESLCPEEC